MRRRGAAGRPRDRADGRVQGPLPRPPRRDQPDRRHRPRAAEDPRAAGARRRRAARRARRSRRSILATNPTLEGEATAMYLAERLEGRVGPRVAHRPRAAGRRRPRVRGRRHAHPRPPGPAGASDRCASSSPRSCSALAQGAGLAALPGCSCARSPSGPLGAPPSVELALLAWLSRRGVHPGRPGEPDLGLRRRDRRDGRPRLTGPGDGSLVSGLAPPHRRPAGLRPADRGATSIPV